MIRLLFKGFLYERSRPNERKKFFVLFLRSNCLVKIPACVTNTGKAGLDYVDKKQR